jgi:hypothetical protein
VPEIAYNEGGVMELNLIGSKYPAGYIEKSSISRSS